MNSSNRDPISILHDEILKTREFRLKPITVKRKTNNFSSEFDIDNDQEFINDYVSMSDFYPEDF